MLSLSAARMSFEIANVAAQHLHFSSNSTCSFVFLGLPPALPDLPFSNGIVLSDAILYSAGFGIQNYLGQDSRRYG